MGLVGEIVIAAFNGLIYYPDNNLLHSLMDKGEVTFGSSVNSRIFLIGSKPKMTEGFLGSGRRWYKHEIGSVIWRIFLEISSLGEA